MLWRMGGTRRSCEGVWIWRGLGAGLALVGLVGWLGVGSSGEDAEENGVGGKGGEISDGCDVYFWVSYFLAWHIFGVERHSERRGA